MRIEGTTTLAAPPEDVWALLTDARTLRQVIPGCEALEPGPDAWRFAVRQRFGQSSGLFDGELRLTESEPNRVAAIDVDAAGALGSVDATAEVSLERTGSGTTLHYSGDVRFDGGLTIFSPRLLETTTRAFLRRSSENLAWQAAVRTGTLPTEAEVACVLPPFDEPESPAAVPLYRRFAPLVAALLLLAAFLWLRDRRADRPSDDPADRVSAA